MPLKPFDQNICEGNVKVELVRLCFCRSEDRRDTLRSVARSSANSLTRYVRDEGVDTAVVANGAGFFSIVTEMMRKAGLSYMLARCMYRARGGISYIEKMQINKFKKGTFPEKPSKCVVLAIMTAVAIRAATQVMMLSLATSTALACK